MAIGSSDWVDHRLFRPLPEYDEEYVDGHTGMLVDEREGPLPNSKGFGSPTPFTKR